jgi:hypothetical protein
LFPLRGAAPDIAGLLVVFALSEFLGLTAALEQFAKPTQGGRDRFSLVNPHSQRHARS